MAKPIGGTCYFKVDGAQLELASDDVTVNIQGAVKTGVVPGYFTESDMIPKIEGEFVVPKGFPLEKLLVMESGTITVELRSGLVASLSGAYVAGEASVDAGKGTCKITFEGTQGEWL